LNGNGLLRRTGDRRDHGVAEPSDNIYLILRSVVFPRRR